MRAVATKPEAEEVIREMSRGVFLLKSLLCPSVASIYRPIVYFVALVSAQAILQVATWMLFNSDLGKLVQLDRLLSYYAERLLNSQHIKILRTDINSKSIKCFLTHY